MRLALFFVVCFFGVCGADDAAEVPSKTAAAPPSFHRVYLRSYTLTDFNELLDLLKNEKAHGNRAISPLATQDKHESTPSNLLSKIDGFLDQVVMLWKDYGSDKSVNDVAKSVHTVFTAKHDVLELILLSRDLYAKAKTERINNFRIANALKKNAGSKIDLATSMIKSIVGDLLEAVQPFDNDAEKNYYTNLAHGGDALRK